MMQTKFLSRGRTPSTTATAGDRRTHRVASAWLVGATAVAFVIGGVLVAGGENPAQRQAVRSAADNSVKSGASTADSQKRDPGVLGLGGGYDGEPTPAVTAPELCQPYVAKSRLVNA